MKKTVMTLMGICLLSLLSSNQVFATNNSKSVYKKPSSSARGKVLTKLPATTTIVIQRDGGCSNYTFSFRCQLSSCMPAGAQWGCGQKSNGDCCEVLQV